MDCHGALRLAMTEGAARLAMTEAVVRLAMGAEEATRIALTR